MINEEHILEIAHRGNSHLNKDNSVASFVSALNESFDMIEIDIQLCKTGEIVVYHDIEIQDKMVIDLSFNELLKMDNDIITLEEFFSIPGMKDAKVYLDLKGCIDLALKLTTFLDNNQLNKENILIASFNLKHLDAINALNLDYKLGFITENNFTNDIYLQLIDDYNLSAICIHWTTLDKESIQFLKNLHVAVYTYTLKNYMILSKMLEYDIDGIVTNYKISD